MSKYLYGASVQGIQGFIFQTNKLKEIVGASELVEEICGGFFKNQLKDIYKEENLLLGAAGNIKYIFEKKEDCEKIVRAFPKAVMEIADGITISQAVVEEGKFPDDIQELERRLRVQRNKAISIRDTAGLMVTKTARRTGGVGFECRKKEVVDFGQVQKLEAFESANRRLKKDIFESNKFDANQFPFDISEMIKKDENQSWIAIIHADGNSLGKKLIKMGSLLKGEEAKKAFKDFSQRLDQSTKEAAKEAFNKTVDKAIKKEGLKKIPFRPVILGGDDLTVIIRGDLALDFAHCFLKEFERVTKDVFESFDSQHEIKETLFSKGLTACAGISYIKANYPFHYGVTLAETLCQEAKNASKKINEAHSPSSLMFHKVHSSFVEDFESIIDRELRAKDEVFFNYGPYFIQEQNGYDTIEQLKKRIENLNKKDAPKSGLRNWLTELRNNSETAKQAIDRIATLNGNRYGSSLNLKEPFTKRKIKFKGEEITGDFTPIYDAMALSKIQSK